MMENAPQLEQMVTVPKKRSKILPALALMAALYGVRGCTKGQNVARQLNEHGISIENLSSLDRRTYDHMEAYGCGKFAVIGHRFRWEPKADENKYLFCFNPF